MMKSVKAVLSSAIIIGILGYFGYMLYSSWDQLKSYNWQINYGYACLAVLFFLFVYAFTVIGYNFVLRFMGFRLPFLIVAKARVASDIASYVPGKVWLLFGRHKFLGGAVSMANTFVSTVLEIFLIIVSGCAAFAVAALFSLQGTEKFAYILIAAVPAGIILVHPRVISFFSNILMRIARKPKITIEVPYQSMLLLLVFYFVYWFVSGMSFYFAIKSVFPIDASALIPIVGIYAASWIVSFVSFLTPAGLGVREGILAFMLKFYIPLPAAMVVSVLFRVMTMAVCVLLMAALAGVRHKKLYAP